MDTKICSKCGEEKEIEKFVKDKNKKDGYRSYCKECENLKRRKTPIKLKAKEGFKICAKCNKELLLECFNKRNGKYFSYCKKCEKEYNNNRYKHICIDSNKEYKSGKKDSIRCKECNSKILAQRGKEILDKLNSNQYGSSNPNWNPNLTDEERNSKRDNKQYREWRSKVFKRDNWTCQCCKIKGKNINAHHLNSYTTDKNNRYNVENGITLCVECHKKFHMLYEYGNNTLEQFEKFINEEYK